MSAQNSVLVQVARPYAAALFDLASEAGKVAEVEASLDGFAALVAESEDFANFLKSPVIDADRKRSVMETILAKAESPEVVGNFMRIVARNRRLFAVPAMIRQFKELAAKARGEVAADVTSAVPLSAAQRKSLTESLKKKIGKTVTLTAHVDPELIGGLVVKVGSQMIDSSLRTKLTAMRIAMKEVG